MKLIKIIFPIIFCLVGCITQNNLSRVKVIFKSDQSDVDILGITGLDMGPIYAPDSYTPKNIGDKSYTSYQKVKLSEEMTIRWKSSHRKKSQIQEATITRPKSIPSIIPANSSLTFLYTGSTWELYLAPLE